MKKVFTPDGTFLGRALKIETTGSGVEITMPGDFPGMTEKTVIYVGGSIVYEDENRVYIKYQPKRSTLERQPRDDLPALMMADQRMEEEGFDERNLCNLQQ